MILRKCIAVQACKDRLRVLALADIRNVGRWTEDENAALETAVKECDQELGLVRNLVLLAKL